MGTTTPLRQELKRRFWPMVEAQGFLRDETHAPTWVTFRRHGDAVTHVFDIQWDKWGRPRFVVNFGQCGPDGIEFRGQTLPRETVLAGWLAVTGQGGWLQPGRGSSTRSWFRQDPTLVRILIGQRALREPRAVVDELIGLFPEVGAWWDRGAIGPHLRIRGRGS